MHNYTTDTCYKDVSQKMIVQMLFLVDSSCLKFSRGVPCCLLVCAYITSTTMPFCLIQVEISVTLGGGEANRERVFKVTVGMDSTDSICVVCAGTRWLLVCGV